MPGYLDRECQRWVAAADNLTISECEHSDTVFTTISTMLRTARSDLLLKTQHYRELPYRFVGADTYSGCVEILRLMTQTPFEKQTKVAQRWIKKYGPTVKQVVND